MTSQEKDELKPDLPTGLGRPALRALSAAGFTRLDQFSTVQQADLLKLHGIGPKSLGLIRSALNARGQSFADPDLKEEIMASTEKVYDSPTEWVRNHIQEYVASDGKQGHLWQGVTTLLLTTRGRKSGQLRRTALIYGQDGKNYLLVASKGGAPTHPLWYLNLVDNPEVELQVGADKIVGRARTATQMEKSRLWDLMSTIFPRYVEYQAKTSRDIPLVIVEPV